MITIDLPKAKLIGHTLRRAKRAAAFAPYDELIAKQIPGSEAATAEATRAIIRTHYAEVQELIEAAATPDEIINALGLDWSNSTSPDL
jgi:hypothetical protein